MLYRLRLAHRLLLIYLLSFVSVAALAYSLIAEKNIAIEFAQKEQSGSAYVAVVRDALLGIIEDQLASAASHAESGFAEGAVSPGQAAAVWTAESRYGADMDTA